MKTLSITAVCTYLRCPCQFFVSYVLGKEEPLNRAMVLGSVKHKVHELVNQQQQDIFSKLKKEDVVVQILRNEYTALLRKAVVVYSNSLRLVTTTLLEAFQSAVPLVEEQAVQDAAIVVPLLAQGLQGEVLWAAITPKIKTEYSIQSKVLGLKGRIDRLECHPQGLVPVELKSGKAPTEGVWPGHRVQAGCYALLLEEMFQISVPRAVVCYLDAKSSRDVVLNAFLKEEIVLLAQNARACFESRVIPKGCGEDGCEACRLCDDGAYVQKALAMLAAQERKA
ncbi:PD-(D/E)XK nuclease family protein [Candidatus Woesearchaeota archaeon]|nr:PD-(D/E)XK nuclease family protein [Candidatus Woesearchaeota archaeon]